MELVEHGCPGCGGTESTAFPTVTAEPPAPAGPWTLRRCSGCESVFLSPRPARPDELYQAGYHVYRAPGPLSRRVRKFAASNEVRLARRYVRAPADVYEVGCGEGEVLAAFARNGYRCSGIEASLGAARTARARGLAVEEGRFDGGRGVAGGYDLVLAAHVLEHVASPLRFLEDVRRILKPGGLALLKLPMAGSLDQIVLGGYSGGLDVPYHLFVPSRPALQQLIETAGLERVAIRADPVPNDWVHGLRKLVRDQLGIPLPFLKPWNPLAMLPFLPLSLAGAALGAPGRVRVVVRRSR